VFVWLMVCLWLFQMVFLPEACDFIGEKRSQFVENAEPLNGETVHSFCQMAKGYKVWLSLGGILEKVDQYVNFFGLSVFMLYLLCVIVISVHSLSPTVMEITSTFICVFFKIRY